MFPFRTQKLSSSTPKILIGWLTGKIGRCQHKRKGADFQRLSFFIIKQGIVKILCLLCVGEFAVSKIVLNKNSKTLNETIKIIIPCESLVFNKEKERIDPITNSVYLDITKELMLVLREAEDSEDIKSTDYADYTLPNPFDYSIVNKGDMLLMSNFWQNEMGIFHKTTVDEFSKKVSDIMSS